MQINISQKVQDFLAEITGKNPATAIEDMVSGWVDREVTARGITLNTRDLLIDEIVAASKKAKSVDNSVKGK